MLIIIAQVDRNTFGAYFEYERVKRKYVCTANPIVLKLFV